ncbi:MAG: serine/threonine protein kinase [Candidatus Riflebacteria bacterium]|nr:serine/threonine protein kinase [Candidatus Riflebacteria bacterium]
MDQPSFSTEFLQKYQVLAKVGEGGMGMVFKAVHRSLMRSTAVKVIHASSFDDEKAIQNFLGEAQLCARLSHPNIVKVYEASIEGGNPYIAFEYIEGITLSEHIRKTPNFPIKDALTITVQVLEGLEAAHEQGVVHRDIKPDNILIDAEGNAKIADFGIAKRSSAKARKSKDWVLVGTPAYMSPEQAWGDEATERSDLYSAGSVLYEMLAGQPPFSGNTMQLVSQKMNSEPRSIKELRPEVPQQLADIVMGALTRRPEDRYPAVEDFVNKLRKARSFMDKWMAEERGDRPRSRVSTAARLTTSTLRATVPATPPPPPPQPTLGELWPQLLELLKKKEWWQANGLAVGAVMVAAFMLFTLLVLVIRSLAQR